MSEPKHQSLWNDLTSLAPIDREYVSKDSDDLVIGAGLTGLATAVLLPAPVGE